MTNATIITASVAASLVGSFTLGYFVSKERRRRAEAQLTTHVPLKMSTAPASPYDLLRSWLSMGEVLQGWAAARFMVLATSSPSEGATARNVLLQSITEDGDLVFGSSITSLKARNISDDPRAELVLRWGQRQVRVRGTVRRGTAAETGKCFQGLPPGAKRGLPELDQGKVIDEAAHDALAARFAINAADKQDTQTFKCPSSYSAFVVTPHAIEFYSGGHPNYINDRILFVRGAASSTAWERMRIQA